MLLVLLGALWALDCLCDNSCHHAFVRNRECNDGLRPNRTLGLARRTPPEGYWGLPGSGATLTRA